MRADRLTALSPARSAGMVQDVGHAVVMESMQRHLLLFPYSAFNSTYFTMLTCSTRYPDELLERSPTTNETSTG